ncbi:tudor domain-containing protein 3 isoform X2 [Brassica napus]|uniref:tudor domain-containing protein 3 isoform X2 n=1 Tax=Brassica oleracea var. oleracea TaxID=109376 RepID=UPI0006A73CEA|nr:PREDICTED: tudor domain-containing protein 3 isoform X2 [Brassica oleracea var. oleracea]XP_013736380.1 tudor domain-containing protein 3 isoform X2 [Brassica napus]
MEEGTSSSSAAGNTSTAVINSLTTRGWCFKDADYLKPLVIQISSVIGGTNQTGAIVDSVEAELLNMDIRLIGGKSLPDATELRRCSHLQGPKVLQISSVRDVTKSSAEEFLGSSTGKRVLKLVLTDGKIEISALEYSHIPSLNNDVTPGTKVRLENKAVVRDGLVCLTPKEVTVLGGHVQSLFEEWQMKRKYASLSRSSGRQSQEGKAGDGPPPFEELQIRAGYHQRDSYKTTSRTIVPTAAQHTGGEKGETSEVYGNKIGADKNLQKSSADSDSKVSVKVENQEKPSSSDTRPKQAVEAVPLQNQAAAQVLLEKMKHSSSNERQYRGRRGRGRGRGREEDDSAVLTLEEWEKRKTSGGAVAAADNPSDTTRDEDLAWQLQNQFDLEDSNEVHGTGVADIRMNMFDYGRTDESFGHGRGRGGRGRGRGRGRGHRRGGGRF